MKKLLVLFVSLAFLATVLSGFSVGSAKSKEVLKPNRIKTVTINGEIVKVNPGIPYNNEMLALKTKEDTYILRGKIGNLKEFVGLSASISGYAYSGPQGIQCLYVKAYKIIEEPKASLIPLPVSTPTPEVVVTPLSKYVVLRGYLDNIDPNKPRFILKAGKTAFELIGSTQGLENHTGKLIEVTGNNVYTLLPTEYPLISVISYRVIEETRPTPIPTQTPTSKPETIVITEKDNAGYVYVKKGDDVKLVLDSNPSTGFKWNYDEKPDENILLQTGYEYISDSNDDMLVGVGGKEVWTFKALNSGTAVMYLSYSRPWESVPPAENFKVKVIVEEVSVPEPTPIILSKVHTVISEKAIYLSDPSTSSNQNATGCTTISWHENTAKAFFNAKVTVGEGDKKTTYEFELSEVKTSDKYSIVGTFNIKRDGVLVANGIPGQVYGIDQPVGSYFKFYSEGEKWHVSGYITSRIDF